MKIKQSSRGLSPLMDPFPQQKRELFCLAILPLLNVFPGTCDRVLRGLDEGLVSSFKGNDLRQIVISSSFKFQVLPDAPML